MVNYIDLIIHDSMSSVTFNEMLIAYSSMDRWCQLGPSYSYNPTLKPVYPVQESCKTLCRLLANIVVASDYAAIA